MSSSDPDGPFFLPLRGGAGQARAAEAPGRTVRGMGTLTLTRAGKSRDGEWSTDDYDVFEGSRLIGHIVLTTQAPQGVPWFWEITARLESTQNRGYAVSCEQALKELKARWANPAKF
ncbi:MAG: hypothetical protein WA704_03315 [Pseudolabrys sp.]